RSLLEKRWQFLCCQNKFTQTCQVPQHRKGVGVEKGLGVSFLRLRPLPNSTNAVGGSFILSLRVLSGLFFSPYRQSAGGRQESRQLVNELDQTCQSDLTYFLGSMNNPTNCISGICGARASALAG
ncbi:MAG TPA: hypothetical protein VNO24_22050, partial [Blastocatellia bacterium]|nr:hypothetical protein [Blastocatellia bacterium]